MHQLNFISKRNLEWMEVDSPIISDEHSVLIRPLTVATCDMDGLAIQGIVPFPGPTPIGHEGEGVITEVGSGVSKWKVGDRAIIPWKIACGSCKSCQRHHSAQCLTVPSEDAYGWGVPIPKWGGFISDTVLVPWADTMLTKLPEGVDPLLACGVADNISDGYRAVAPHLKERPGGTVLVTTAVAPGSIGLYAAGIAVALGAEKVVYADTSQTRLEIAATLGAEPIFLTKDAIKKYATDKRSLDGGFDITVDACGVPEIIPELIAATSRAGVCVSTAGVIYRGNPLPFDVYSMYRKSISFHTGWVHTHSFIDESLGLITSGQFDPSPVTTKVVSWDDAADALIEPFTKIIISRSQ